jgi:glycerol-1-phosphate dehydrogenase [NAD(P)+]
MALIDGQTNVASYRFGSGCLRGIGKEVGRFIVTTMPVPWDITKAFIGATPESVIMVDSVEQHSLDKTVQSLPPCETILAIGGGKAIDAGKYFSWKLERRLVTIPTILSVDAFVTPAAGVRVNHEVIYVGSASPDPLIIDGEIIRTAPPSLNIAGIGDLLSMHTATFDWEFAQSNGKSEYKFEPQAIKNARQILEDLYSLLPEIKAVSDKGLQAIVEGYMRMNAICLPLGHYRVEEGSEHFLFYELEERLKRSFIHGYIVGLGIFLMSRLQQNDADTITRIMNEVGLNYHPKELQITYQTLSASLKNLRTYVKSKEQLWYTIIDESEMTDDWIKANMTDLKF